MRILPVIGLSCLVAAGAGPEPVRESKDRYAVASSSVGPLKHTRIVFHRAVEGTWRGG